MQVKRNRRTTAQVTVNIFGVVADLIDIRPPHPFREEQQPFQYRPPLPKTSLARLGELKHAWRTLHVCDSGQLHTRLLSKPR
jgi:hypothetical protein